jgi:hypothetical protein
MFAYATTIGGCIMDTTTIKEAIERDECPTCNYFLRVEILDSAVRFYCASLECGWSYEYERGGTEAYNLGVAAAMRTVAEITEVFHG